MASLTGKQDGRLAYIIEETYLTAFGRLASIFLGPWLIMLALGAFAHQAHYPYLYRFGFWECWLVWFIVRSLGPDTFPARLKVKER